MQIFDGLLCEQQLGSHKQRDNINAIWCCRRYTRALQRVANATKSIRAKPTYCIEQTTTLEITTWAYRCRPLHTTLLLLLYGCLIAVIAVQQLRLQHAALLRCHFLPHILEHRNLGSVHCKSKSLALLVFGGLCLLRNKNLVLLQARNFCTVMCVPLFL